MSLQKQSILFINGLDKAVNENMLYTLFNDYSISYIKIVKDHQTHESFGYAFIGFKNYSKAEEALQKLNYSKLAKKTIHISWFNREPENYRNKIENNIFVKKIPKDISQKEFHEIFSKYGNIISSKLAEDEEGNSMGYGFVLYDTKEGAKNAINECNGKELKGKKLFVGQFVKNRPKQPLKFNNIYVRNIPKEWSEKDVKKIFAKYGEINSMIVKRVEEDKLKKLPEKKRRQILNHKYAFICYKHLDGPAQKAIAKVPYLKILDEKYNKKIEEIGKIVNNAGIKDDDKYKCACYILDNNLAGKVKVKEDLEKVIIDFNNLMKENDGAYIVKNKDNRLFCCQALKKHEREKKLKLLYEKIKTKIKEKYKFCNLYIKNLPIDFTDENLKELFGKYGKIRSAKVVKKEMETFYLMPKKIIKVFGFVCFFEPVHAMEAKKNLKNISLLENGPRLYIDYHQNKKERAEFLKLKFINITKNYKNIPYMIPPLMRIRLVQPNFNSLEKQMKQKIVHYDRLNQEEKMNSHARNEFYGEKLFYKINKMPQFTDYSEYFSKIVGIFLDLDDNVLDKLIKDDKYFIEQIQETIKLLSEKEKSN